MFSRRHPALFLTLWIPSPASQGNLINTWGCFFLTKYHLQKLLALTKQELSLLF